MICCIEKKIILQLKLFNPNVCKPERLKIQVIFGKNPTNNPKPHHLLFPKARKIGKCLLKNKSTLSPPVVPFLPTRILVTTFPVETV